MIGGNIVWGYDLLQRAFKDLKGSYFHKLREAWTDLWVIADIAGIYFALNSEATSNMKFQFIPGIILIWPT